MPKFGEFWESCRNASNSVLTDAVSRVITESLGLWVVDAGGRMELDILMVIAEIAVALAGFAAVVANFSENWTKAKSKQVTNLLTQSGIALFASMVPLIMSQMRADDSAGIDTVWMVSSASYVFFASSYLAVSLFLSRSRSSGSARCGSHLSTHVYRGDRGANLQSLRGGAGVDLSAGTAVKFSLRLCILYRIDQTLGQKRELICAGKRRYRLAFGKAAKTSSCSQRRAKKAAVGLKMLCYVQRVPPTLCNECAVLQQKRSSERSSKKIKRKKNEKS